MKRVDINEITYIVHENDNGDYWLLDCHSYDQIKQAIISLQEYKNELERIKKSLRIVCLDTENPIYF